VKYPNCSTEFRFRTCTVQYEQIVLKPRRCEEEREDLDAELLKPALDQGHLLYTRDLAIPSKFRDVVYERCSHHQSYRNGLLDEDDKNDHLARALVTPRAAIEDGKLRSLR
jgi:hypothetical protein